MVKFSKEDNLFGLAKEQEYQEAISKIIGQPITKTKFKYCYYDYYSEDEKIRIELKSRRVSSTDFHSTFFTLNKLISINKFSENKEHLLVFGFTDGLFSIWYDREKFNQFKSEERIVRTYLNNGEGYIVTNVLIPVSELTKL
jgi:hypothetical protein